MEKVYTSVGRPNRQFPVNGPEVMPKYPGGYNAFLDYIGNSFIWPKEALAAKLEGKLLAEFVVEKDGSLTDILILNDLGYGTGSELERVLKNSIKWTPGKQNGSPVRVAYTVPVNLVPPPASTPDFLPASALVPKIQKMAPLQPLKAKYYFESIRDKCKPNNAFLDERGRQALSDRYSVIDFAVSSVNPDSLKNAKGRVAFQVLIDSTGTGCTLSYKNESNLGNEALKLCEALDWKIRWNLQAGSNGKKEIISAILVFTFTDDKVIYQHVTFGANGGQLVELESSEKRKSGRW